MVIRGREYGFKMTIGASGELAKLCPNNDIKRVREIFGDDYADSLENSKKFVLILNKWFVKAEKFDGREADELSAEMLDVLTPDEFAMLSKAAMRAFSHDTDTEVKTKNVEAGGEQ